MQKILIPTDFSENARHAAHYIFTLNEGLDVSYTLLNTYDIPRSGAGTFVSIEDILRREAENLLKEELQKLEEAFPALKGKIDAMTRMGAPGGVIRDLTTEGAYQMVVMGTKGADGLKRALIGSVASKVMTNTPCPVMAIPQDAELKAPKTVVFAVDDEGMAKQNYPSQLAEFALRYDSEILIVNVVKKGQQRYTGGQENGQQPLEVFSGVKHSFHVVEAEEVNEGIHQFVLKNEADMLAMVTRRNDFIGLLFGLSNTNNMIQDATVPMMVFH